MNNLTPQSMRSPVTPFDEHAKPSFSTQGSWTPITPQAEPATMEQSARGLGIFDCPMPHPQSTVQEMPPSPHDSEAWSHSSMVDQETYFQNTQRPNISSADYDPFSSYNSSNNQAVLSVPPEEAPALVFCHTPPSTNMASHRSSVSSSCSPPHQHAEFYTQRVKTEDRNEWYSPPGNEHVLQRSLTTHGYSPYSNGVSPIVGPAEDLYRTQTGDWSKSTSAAYSMEFNHVPRFDATPLLPSANRIKKKRQRTTPEEATHKCEICDKLFKRSYNYKSHMETHNPQRKYPHPCTAMNGTQQCTKKFQRKTDLDRHVDSVHLKARNHRCDQCGNRFARRDTLRRHTEDGCPKRFELGFRDTNAPPPNAAPQPWAAPTFGNPDRRLRPGGNMPQPFPSILHPASAQPAPQPFFPRPEFVNSPLQHSTSDFAP